MLHLLLQRRSHGKGVLVLQGFMFACAEQEARKGATGEQKFETNFLLVANSPLSGIMIKGCVGKKQQHWERLSSLSGCFEHQIKA